MITLFICIGLALIAWSVYNWMTPSSRKRDDKEEKNKE